MIIGQGKMAKHMGRISPRVARKIDAEPPRPTPKKVTKPKRAKNYGFVARSSWRDYKTKEWKEFSKWSTNPMWYESAKKRDQAMQNYHGYFRDPTRQRVEVKSVNR